ncbi:MAG: DNA-processing protein DprA [Bacteroidota bacterium]
MGLGETDGADRRALLALSMVPGVGAGKIRQLVAYFGTAQDVLNASFHTLLEVKGIGPGLAKAIVQFNQYPAVDEQFRWAGRAEALLLPFWDDRYPRLLHTIYDPPAFLWMRGDASVLDKPAVAIVGTRRPSAYGLRAATHFAKELASRGFVILSGLAYGIDGAAHSAALEAGGCSVAVLGSGIDRIYPAKHMEIARQLVLQGALVSELPLRAKPDAANFPKRNRIISGLSLGTLVVEAFEKGGALITARMALEQNREVFAVPGSIFSQTAAGCHGLIAGGQAKLVHSVDDVLDELGVVSEAVSSNGQDVRKKTAIDNAAQLQGIERRLYDLLGEEPRHIDALCDAAAVDVSTALVYLLSLEFKGFVRQLAGKQFYRC